MGLLAIRTEYIKCRIHRLEGFGERKGVDERINESLLQWFDYIERMEKSRIAKKSYEGERTKSRPVDKQQKR